MRIKHQSRLLKIVFALTLIWSILLICKLHQSNFLNTDNQTSHSELCENKRDVDMIGQNINYNRIICENSPKACQLHKQFWPPQAVPGDEGYGGVGVSLNRSLLQEREKVIYDNGLKMYSANQFVSDRVPLRRNIDFNMPECENLTYDTANLPTVGIVIIFVDEMWSALMRTVFSILDASPEELISEIILVDDGSQKVAVKTPVRGCVFNDNSFRTFYQRHHLGKPLDDYLKIFNGKVKVVRLPERRGLIEARLVGFDHVTGEAVIYLDAHVEVNQGWLEPLLHRIKQDDTVIAIPHTDVIDWNTFKFVFSPNNKHRRCGVEFNMKYSWIPIPPPDGIKRTSLADPVETPAHMGCCFATYKRNFDRLGKYDPGLMSWGCENVELSLKAWMCGSRLEVIPCSHIGHMYRPHFPYKLAGKPFAFERNCLRVAEVWMDNYKVFYHERIDNFQTTLEIGDVSERKALREKLKCRSFDWYIKEVYPDLYIPTNTTAIGRIASVRYPSLCVKWFSFDHLIVENCTFLHHKQYFYLTRERHIRRDGLCLSYNNQYGHFESYECGNHTGKWKYTQENLVTFEDSGLCMTVSRSNSSVVMVTCNSTDTSQQWNWPRKSITLA